ncbi:DUF349 domain-containing protein [Nocardioides dongxiaopingii]|uniref:DUF349 domain-containing protein n=1 Tax=Nocardioides sp. S-1144 TaxID=2582905 RepID=UPI00110E10FB|nr:DUF349 domain-containing protein [Nocardioides sp. S-1144]QCW50959.1 DUF349 domain-containing protein [Nocardioides sp. S-1144]
MTSSEWGRVDDDGTVYVKTADGERSVGSYPAGTPQEALQFFTERFDALSFEVQLLEQRVNAEKLTPEEAAESIKTVRAQVTDANAVGDLASLGARLDALAPVLATQREARRAERAAKAEESKAAKEQIVAEAEKIATGTDWRNGANRLRDLLEAWKALPRIDRPSDDALWKRFSGARTAYTKARKQHFAEQDEKREGARVVKERLAKEAEALATSTEWGPTAGRYRDLMRDWKAAGPAPKDVDDALWKRFRGAQDQFFGARDAENAALDAEFAANADVKDALIVEIEALLPVQDLEATKKAFRDLADKWEAAGKVPRDRMRDLEGRMRAVENALRSAEDDAWKRSDPEKSARANDMVTKLEDAIAKVESDLEKARAAGNEKKVKELEDNLESRRSFLDMARRASEDFSG